MRSLSKAVCALLAAWLVAIGASTRASAQPTSACGALEFSSEVLMADAHTNLCPKPVNPTLELLYGKLERTPGKDTAVFLDVLTALRDYCLPSAPDGWRTSLARHIDEALTRAKELQQPAADFAAVRGPTPDVDPESCLFVTGDAGSSGYACYVIAGAPKPAIAELAVYELADFSDAYLAHRALGVASAAIAKHGVPELAKAVRRLTQANQRWDNLRKRGYLQYPWELWFSSAFAAYDNYLACTARDLTCTGEEGLDPERLRLIALHPGVGMGFSGFGKNAKPSADASLALSLEVLGATYYEQGFSNYYGVSLGAVVNDGKFADVRPGVFLHITRWLHIGYLLSLFQRSTRYDATVFLSTDLGTALGATFLE